jgi:hypothetical protein
MTTSIYLFAVKRLAPEAMSAPLMTASAGTTFPGSRSSMTAFVHDHYGDNGIEAFGFDQRDVVGDDDLSSDDLVALVDVGGETFALQRDGVQTQVHQNSHIVRGHDDVGVRHQFQKLAADRSDRLDHTAGRVDRGAVAHHALREDGIGNVRKRNRPPRDRGQHWRRTHDGPPLLVRTHNTSVPERQA